MPEFKKGDGGFLNERRKQIKGSLNPEQEIMNLDTEISVPEEQVEQTLIVSEKNEIIIPVEKGIRGVGRPKKKGILRNIPKTTKLDKQTERNLQLLKIDYKLDQQDVIFLAIQEYYNAHFPKGKAKSEDLQIIRKQIDELNGIL